MKSDNAPPLRDIVLLGGGHANVQVLKRFGMRFEPGVRLTVVAREPHSPYTGMLPGYVAGAYGWDEIHIDLAKLARFANARFIAAEASGIDTQERRVLFADRPPLRYDVLSINTGGVPGERFASDFVTPVKPIGRFLPIWEQLTADDGPPARLGIVGAGPGGVELALAINHRYPGTRCTLLDAGGEILGGLAAKARRRLQRALRERGVSVVTGARVTEAYEGQLIAGDTSITVDHALWTTCVEAPKWFAESGLDTDAAGFVAVNEYLQSPSHEEIFAAGDVSHSAHQPRPKSGVYAVRQGPLLAENLRRFVTGRRLRRFRAQRHAMAIVGLGIGDAVASRGRFHASGAWVWFVKRWIDRRFMRKFSKLPAIREDKPHVAAGLRKGLPRPMRCGGCGAKLGADSLNAVLSRLDIPVSASTVSGIGDDAAIVQVPAGSLAMSCDGFRAMIDDTYRFGRIGAHHALNDLFAMGADPKFALAIATVPLMADPMMEDDLLQMMSGARDVFAAHGVDLVGGHSAEGDELGLAFSVTGTLAREPLNKAGLSPGEALVLTGAIGTGTLLAGAMLGRTRAEHLLTAIDHMDRSNAAAADVLCEHGARGCTDVTGFGLAGHLSEMTRASGTGASIRLADVPTLPGALELIGSGVESSLQPNNQQALADYEIKGGTPDAPGLRLLADPQTSGGLLAGVPAHATDDCVQALRGKGYAAAAVVGLVTQQGLAIVIGSRPGSAG
ncbi:MAG: selenide, water dikinase SelD [Gammaproteobacteria bacterium]|nr:selenide, water dikinase SelD [Gammaproteobacteria bacterium]